MRLIDADELIKGRVENDPVRIAVECAPTAFNKEKVIEELKQIFKALLMAENFNGAACIDKAIEIVEKGGIE